MGFFNKKKNADTPSSVLSESEIQKKLYGEFSDRTSHVVIGDREHSREPASSPVLPKESPVEKDTDFDLFKVQKDALSEPSLSPRPVSQEPKTTDSGSRYVPLHDFEKKPISSTSPSSTSDPYTRFPYNRPQENKWGQLPDLLKGFSEKAGELVRFLLDPRQVVLRRFFYWGTAVLVVFILFWGVNTLNSQREEAMRARYKIPGESISEKKPDVVAAVVPAQPAAERPVVITPAPVRPPKTRAPEGSSATSASSGGSYVIQVVTYPSAQDADSIVKTLKSSGFHAFVKESARPNGGVFYMVLIGGFRTAAEAQAQLSKFRSQEIARPFQDAFVRTNRS
jgi:septal ring-binding cell division protein DamX